VLAAVLPGPILAEYEAAVRAAGYEPGAVLPSSLAALEAIDSMEAVLAANLSRWPSPPTIANGLDLLLYRTLDLPGDPANAVEIQRAIAVAAAYFEDKLGMRPRGLYYAGCMTPDEFALLSAIRNSRRRAGATASEGTLTCAGPLKPVLPASQARWRGQARPMRITLNLATRPFADLGRPLKRLRIAMAVLAGLCIAVRLGLPSLHQEGRSSARPRSLARRRDRPRPGRACSAAQAMMRQPVNARSPHPGRIAQPALR
jgi:hypothetical protein